MPIRMVFVNPVTYVHRDNFVICVLDCTGSGKTADIKFYNLSRIYIRAGLYAEIVKGGSSLT